MRRGDQELFPRRLDTNVAGAEGELTVNVAGTRAYVHDGKTPGGVPLVDALGPGLKRVGSGITIPNRRPKRIIGIGDSIMQSSSSHAPSGFDAKGNRIPDNWRSGTGIFEQTLWKANGLGTNGQWQFLANQGIAGQTTTQILARFDNDVIAYKPDVCWIMAGTNDITLGGGDAEIAGIMNRLEQMVLKCINAGIAVLLATPPCRDAAAASTQNIQPFYYDLANYYNIPLLDVNRVVVNPVNGTYKAGLSADGVHPNNTASDSISNELAKALANPEQYINRPYLAASSFLFVNNHANLLINGNFSQGVDGGNNPLGWTTNQSTGNTGSVATAASLPYTGQKFLYTVPPAGAVSVYALFSNNVDAVFPAGDVLEFSAALKITGMNPATSAGVSLMLAFDGPFSTAAAPVNAQVTNMDGVVTGECYVPQGCTSINMQLYSQDQNVTYTVQNATVTNRTMRARAWAPGLQ